MGGYQKVFKRVEEKYIFKKDKYESLMEKIADELEANEYPHSKIMNIYYDTVDFSLAMNSISKPTYKEKVRLRSYGVPSDDGEVFLELKRKCLDVVTKRRIGVKYNEFKEYTRTGVLSTKKSQIYNEIDYAFKRYNLVPKIMVAYDRDSYYLKEDENFRITFDKNLRSRLNDLDLSFGDMGELFFDDVVYILEIKTCTSIPIWFVRVLNELKIYPTSFSKYGEIYKKKILQGK